MCIRDRIISNHPDLQHVAERFGIPFYLFPITKENKKEQEKAEMEQMCIRDRYYGGFPGRK